MHGLSLQSHIANYWPGMHAIFFVVFAGSKWKGIDKAVISMQGKTFNFLVHGHENIPKQNLYSQESGYTASAVHFLFTWNEPSPNTLVAL